MDPSQRPPFQSTDLPLREMDHDPFPDSASEISLPCTSISRRPPTVEYYELVMAAPGNRITYTPSGTIIGPRSEPLPPYPPPPLPLDSETVVLPSLPSFRNPPPILTMPQLNQSSRASSSGSTTSTTSWTQALQMFPAPLVQPNWQTDPPFIGTTPKFSVSRFQSSEPWTIAQMDNISCVSYHGSV